MNITLEEQYLEVQREIAMRRRCYPRWIDQGTLSEAKAGRQLRTMEAVLETIRKARQDEAMTSKLTGKRIDREDQAGFDLAMTPGIGDV